MNKNSSFKIKVFLTLLSVLVCISPAQPATTQPVHDSHQWEKAITAFEAADHHAMPAPGGVLFVGSSTIRMWKVKSAFRGENVINRGFGGSWVCDSVYYADRIVIPYKPRTVIFYAGDNDINAGVSAAEVAKGFKEFVKRVHAALPETRIVFISIKPSPSRWKFWSVMQEANDSVRDFADHTARVLFVNMTPFMLGPDSKPREELFQADGVHMNARGYAIWNKKIAQYVKG